MLLMFDMMMRHLFAYVNIGRERSRLEEAIMMLGLLEVIETVSSVEMMRCFEI
jgi:hypothetical protein